MKKILTCLIITFLLLTRCFHENSSGNNNLKKHYKPISLSIFDDSVQHARGLFKNRTPPYPVYNEYQIAGIAETMLILQNKDGGWPKNVDWFIKLDHINPEKVKIDMILNGEGGGKSAFDNRTTYSHIDYLAKVYSQIPEEKYKSAIKKAINWVFSSQNKTSHGFTGIDVDAVTYNDDVMTGVLRVLKEISLRDDLYHFLDNDLRKKALIAYTQGLDCILRSQVRVDGKLMAWGQQHDHETLEPIWAREYEPPSITANESVGIIELLMEIERPSQKIIDAVCAACEFYFGTWPEMLLEKSYPQWRENVGLDE